MKELHLESNEKKNSKKDLKKIKFAAKGEQEINSSENKLKNLKMLKGNLITCTK